MAKQIEFDSLFNKGSFDAGVADLVKVIGKITEEIELAELAGRMLSETLGKKLKGEIASISSVSKTLSKDLSDMTKKMEEYKMKTVQIDKVTKAYKDETERLTKELEKLKLAQEKANKETEKTEPSAKKAKNAYTSLAQSMLGVASGAVLIHSGITTLKEQLIEAVQSTIAFEKTMKEVQAVSGSTAEELKLLTNNANKLGSTTEKTAQQVAEAQKELAKLGFSTPEILMVTEAIVNLSTATGEDLVKSAEVAASTLRAFGLDVSEMKRVTDVMTKSFVISALDLEKFRESIKLVAPIAAATNIGIEAVTASLAKLSDTGISGSLAGTAMRNLISSMADPTEDLVKFLGNYDSTLKDGVKSSEDFTRALQVLKGANIDLETAVGMVDVRARTAFFTLVNYADDVEGLAVELKYLDDETRRVATTMRDTLANDIDVAKSAFDSLRRNLVEEHTPAMREATQAVTEYIEAIRFANSEKQRMSGGKPIEVIEIGMMSGVVNAFGKVSDAIYNATKASNELNKANDFFIGLDTELKSVITAYDNYNEVLKDNVQASGLIKAGADGNAVAIKLLEANYSDIAKSVKIAGGSTRDFLILVRQETDRLIKTSEGHITTLAGQEEKLNEFIFSLKEEDKVKRLNKTSSENLAKAELELARIQLLRLSYTEKINLALKTNAVTADELAENAEKELSVKSNLLKLENKLQAIYAKSAEDRAKFALEEEETLAVKFIRLQEYTDARIDSANQALNAEIRVAEASDADDREKNLQKQIAYAKHKQDLLKISQEYAKQEGVISKQILDFDQKLLNQEIKDVLDKHKVEKEGLDGFMDYYNKTIEDKQKKQDEQGDKDYEDLVKYWETVTTEEEAAKERRLALAEQVAQGLNEVSTKIFDNQAMRRANEMTAIDSWEQERLKMAGDNEEAKEAIEKEAEKRRNKIRTEQAKADKKEAIFQIAIQTALAIMKASVAALPPFNIPFIVAAAALGAAQLAAVIARPLPKFAKGTDFSPEGHAIVGERGRELIKDGRSGNWRMSSDGASQTYLSRGSKVIPAHITSKILEGSHDHNGIAEQYLNKLSKKEEKQLFDYNELGKQFKGAVADIPVNQTNFDENGVTRFTIKRNSKVQRLNKRY